MREFPHILALERSPSFAKRLGKELENLQLSCDFRIVESSEGFLQALGAETPPDALIVGSGLENADPLSVLASVRALNISVPVMVVLEKGDLETGIQCLKSGATDVVRKSGYKQLAHALKEALGIPARSSVAEYELQEDTEAKARQTAPQDNPEHIITELRRINAELIRRLDNQTLQLSEALRQRQLAKQELRDKDIFFYKLAEHSGDLIIIVDREGVIQYENPALVRILGYKQDELVGQSAFAFIHPDDISYPKFIFTKYRDKPGPIPQVECRLRNKNGSWVYVEVIGNNLIDDETVKGILIVARNITERKFAEIRLVENEVLLDSILSTAAIAICLSDETGRFINANPFCCRLFGYERHELIGQNFTMLLPPEQRETAKVAYDKFISDTIYRSTEEWKGLRKDGTVRELYTTAGIFKNAEMKRFIVLTFTDITERKKGQETLRKAHEKLELQYTQRTLELREFNRLLNQKISELTRTEAALRESAEKFHLTFDQSAIGAAITSLDFRFVSVNRAYCKIVGYSAAELQTMHISDITHPDDFEKQLELLKRIETGQPNFTERFSKRVFHKNGHIVWCHITTGLVRDQNGKPLYYLAQVEDFSEQKKIEAALIESTDLLETIMDRVPGSVYRAAVRPDGRFSLLFISNGIRDLTGIDPDVLINNPESVFDSIHPDDRNDFTRKVRESVQTLAPHNTEYRLVSRTGQMRWVRDSAYYQKSDTGEVIVDGVCFDITDLKQAEEALKASERDYRNIFENAHDPIVIFEPDGERILELNRRACALYGYSREELLNISMIDISKYPARGKLYLNELLKRGYYKGFETVHIRKDGTELMLEINATQVTYKGQKAVLSINHDLTERKHTENALRQSERQYRRIVDTAHEGIWLLRPDSSTEYVNQQMADLLGYTPEEMQNTSIFKYAAPDEHPTLTNRFISSKKGVKHRYDIRFLRKDGSALWAILSASSRIDLHGDYIGSLVMVTDITDRKLAENALRQSEERYRTLAENFPNGVAMIIDRSYRCILARGDVLRKSSSKLWKRMEGNLVGDTHPSEVAGTLISRSEAAFRGENQFFEILYLKRNWEVYIVPNTGEDGKINTLTLIGHDISHRKKIEKALRNRMEFEALITKISTRLINLPASEIDSVINEGLEQVANFIGAELGVIYKFTDDCKTAIHTHRYNSGRCPDFAPIIPVISTEQFQPIMEKLLRFEIIHIPSLDALPAEAIQAKDAIREMRVSALIAIPVRIENVLSSVLAFIYMAPSELMSEEVVQLLEIFRDMIANALERKRNEEELEKSHLRYQTIVDTQTELVSRSLPDGTLTFVNQAYCRYFGKSVEELLGSSIMVYVPQGDKHVSECGLSGMSPEKPNVICEHRVICGNGTLRWLQWTNSAIFNEAGDVIEVQSVGRDITEQHLTQDALRESEERHRIISELITDYVYYGTVRPNQSPITIWVTGAFEKITGYTLEEINAFPNGWRSLIHPHDLMILRTDFPDIPEKRIFEYRITTKSGQTRWLRDHLMPVPDKNEIGVFHLYGAVKDITDLKRAEQALVKSEARHRQSIENTPHPIFTTDKFGLVRAWNQAAATAFGYELSEIVGQKWEVLLPGTEDRKKVKAILGHVMQGHQAERTTVTYRCKDGHDRLMFVYLYAMPDESSEINMLVFTSVDVDWNSQEK